MKYRINKRVQHRALKWLKMVNNVMAIMGYGVVLMYLSDLLLGSNLLCGVLL